MHLHYTFKNFFKYQVLFFHASIQNMETLSQSIK